MGWQLGYYTPTLATYLSSRDVADGTAVIQIPDDHQTPSVADSNLIGVDGVLLQGLNMFQIPVTNVVIWYTGVTSQQSTEPTEAGERRKQALFSSG